MPNDILPPKPKPKAKRPAPNISDDKIKASKIIKSLFIPYIKRQSIDIIDRIRYYIIIRRYLTSIKEKENCLNIYDYDAKTKDIIYRIGNRIILDKQIGTTMSASGIVFLSHFKSNVNYGYKYDKLNKFAVKITNNDTDNKKELDILENLTKLVRMGVCPHFPISYGYLVCNNTNNRTVNEDDVKLDKKFLEKKDLYPLVIIDNKKILISLNELANGDFYSLTKKMKYEKLKKNNNKDYIITFNINFSNIVCQCFLSMMFLNSVMIQHNDSHIGNFLYHKIKPGGYFHYNIYGKDYYLENQGYLMVIWDFGLSSEIGKDKKKPIIYDYAYFFKSLYYMKDEVDLKYLSELNDIILKYNKTTDIYLVNLFNIDILNFFLNNEKSFITIKPSNIINKTPYIIEKK
jgi:hypothetical protein